MVELYIYIYIYIYIYNRKTISFMRFQLINISCFVAMKPRGAGKIKEDNCYLYRSPKQKTIFSICISSTVVFFTF